MREETIKVFLITPQIMTVDLYTGSKWQPEWENRNWRNRKSHKEGDSPGRIFQRRDAQVCCGFSTSGEGFWLQPGGWYKGKAPWHHSNVSRRSNTRRSNQRTHSRSSEIINDVNNLTVCVSVQSTVTHLLFLFLLFWNCINVLSVSFHMNVNEMSVQIYVKVLLHVKRVFIDLHVTDNSF